MLFFIEILRKVPEPIRILFSFLLSRTIWRKEKDKFVYNGDYSMYLNLSSGQEVLRLLEGYEYSATNIFKKLLEDSKIIIDIGAREGLYSLIAAQKLKDIKNVKIVAIDPDPIAIDILKQTVKINKFNNIIVSDYAVGNSSGFIEMYPTSPDINSPSLTLYKKAVNFQGFSIRVKKESFDNLMKLYNLSDIDIVKIDVEGAEKEVLECMKEKICKHLILEFHKKLLPNKYSVIFPRKSGHFEELVVG